MNIRTHFCCRILALCSAVATLGLQTIYADTIADSIAEFSGVQGQNGWFNGYRIYLDGEPADYDPVTGFTAYPGGTDAGTWDGFSQTWTGSVWDLNTAEAAPWTSQGAQSLHPNGSNNGEEHWNIRRWVADELTELTPLAINWTTLKENTGSGNGVTGAIYQNGVRKDFAVIAGNDGTGVTRTFYLNVAKGDKIDLLLSPVGVDGGHGDGADGSANSMRIDNTIPTGARQPDGAVFIPANTPDTDNDNLADTFEYAFFPDDLTKMTGAGDNDSDGLTNRQEQDLGLDPTKSDTDGDGLADNVESNTGTFVSATNTGTNPRLADTDGDGRIDGDEVNGTVKSNPLLTDTDDDTFSDSAEVASGHNPNDAQHNPNTTQIGNSEVEFSGVQGQDQWFHGYLNVTGSGVIADYTPTSFIPFPGGQDAGDWDGVTQVWTGSAWDLNTAAAGPWTELGPLDTHPSGVSPLHWVVRRWQASELTSTTPVTLRYRVRKLNIDCGNGVTAGVFIDGKLADSVSIPFNQGTFTTRTYYANLSKDQFVDVILSPRGADGNNADGCDGSQFSLIIDPVVPTGARQPDGSLFIPANASDTDADGLPDAWEMLYAQNLTQFSAAGDFDLDGLNDAGEYNRDSNPTLADTDSDGLSDLAETGTGTYVSPTSTGSSPKKADSDSDGLNDAAEVNGTVRTDPNKSDSDADGFSDPAELSAGTDPNSAADNPLTYVIANSQAEFSGTQGQGGWFNGYRNYTLDGGAAEGTVNYDPNTMFIEYAGGEGMGAWDGVSQMWTGTAWDLNTAASAPWTEQGPLNLHPNGTNSEPLEEHWVIRRWKATEVTQTTPVAIIWNAHKNAAGGGGITGSLHINGVQVDAKTIPGTDITGEVRRFYVNLAPGDIVDLAVTPQGPTDRRDGSDGSSSWFWVDTRLPLEPRQPNGTLFVPANAPDSDGDGLPDFWERIFSSDLATLNGTGDNDNDTLSNSTEYTRDSNPIDADTDDDGLSDAVENRTGTFVSATNTGTNPRSTDSDNDTLTDSAEINTHGTDPNKVDTDGDTFSDSSEIATGHNPKDATSNPNTSNIGDSRIEFSGVQGQDGWFYGYRNFSADGGGVNYDDSKFVQFVGGDQAGGWDGVTQQWTGTQWDLETADAGPWTELGRENSHPNGVNSAPNQEHWTVRRWVATELTAGKPLAIRYHVRKVNGGGTGVTGALHINGTRVDSIAVLGNNTTGVIRTFYANVQPGDKIDLVHTPVGPTGDIGDGADGSALWMQIDSVIPPNPIQPDGTPFVVGGRIQISGIAFTGNQSVLTWSSAAGETYTIQASQNLTSWDNLKTGHPSGGATTSYTDTSSVLTHRFYRIQRE